jgi:hypothetical protein
VLVLIAEWLVRLAGLYLATGVVFAVPFLAVGVRRIDPGAAEGSLGFRLIVFPGVVAFWPLLLKRWLAGQTEPPDERSPHRCAAIRVTEASRTDSQGFTPKSGGGA